jgi:hypothetical protein
MYLKNVKLQFLLVAGVSALLGYAATYGKLNSFQKADAGSPDQAKAAPAAPGCCSDGIFSRLDWFPTFVAAAGDPDIVDELKKGKDVGGTKYKVHLDGYNQMDLLTGKGPSKRHEIFYFTEGTLSAVRIDSFNLEELKQKLLEKANHQGQ